MRIFSVFLKSRLRNDDVCPKAVHCGRESSIKARSKRRGYPLCQVGGIRVCSVLTYASRRTERILPREVSGLDYPSRDFHRSPACATGCVILLFDTPKPLSSPSSRVFPPSHHRAIIREWSFQYGHHMSAALVSKFNQTPPSNRQRKPGMIIVYDENDKLKCKGTYIL